MSDELPSAHHPSNKVGCIAVDSTHLYYQQNSVPLGNGLSGGLKKRGTTWQDSNHFQKLYIVKKTLVAEVLLSARLSC